MSVTGRKLTRNCINDKKSHWIWRAHIAVFGFSTRAIILPLVQAMVLIALANSSPLVAKLIFNKAYAWPIDNNLTFLDGRPLLGASKTVRGVVVSLITTTLGAWLLGLGMRIGLLVAAAAMGGDLLSSFAKRRLSLSPSSRATGLDGRDAVEPEVLREF